jgi:ferredoxin
MPSIDFRGRTVDCAAGAVLRDALFAAGETPHNGRACLLNCRGNGSCGTCAVAVSGPVSEPTRRERLRLSVPPHDPDAGLRLACQTRVLGDVTVEKFDGFWGQHVGGADDTVSEVDEPADDPDGGDADDR